MTAARPREPEWDVAIVGDGPAGRALALACRGQGLRTVSIGQGRSWTATYATWLDDVSAVTSDVIAAWGPIDAIGLHRHTLGPRYGVFDNHLLRAKLSAGESHRVGTVTHVEHSAAGTTLTFDDGDKLAARLVVDASGSTPALLRPERREAPVQTAYGVVIDGRPPTLAGEHAVLMDWTPPPGFEQRAPTFLYAVPLAHGRWLVEETSLARRDGVGFEELRARLVARLGNDVIARSEHIEEVSIPMRPGVPSRSQLVVGFGAAGRYLHPATGYSVATSLRLAPTVAAAIAASIEQPLLDRVESTWKAIWPRPMRQVRAVHDYGLGSLLRLSASDVGSFFDAFFDLPDSLWRQYLEIDCSPADIRRVMTRVFRGVPWTVRRQLAAGNPFGLARVVR